MLGQSVIEKPRPVSHQRSAGVARLSVKETRGKTKVADLYQAGCAKLRLPTSNSDALQAVMINSSGGMTGGDHLKWDFHAGAKTSLTVTTQACERVYAASSGTARTSVKLRVDDHARLAWLPQETILFSDGAYAREISVDLNQRSELLLVEPILFGRKAMDEVVTSGFLKDRWRIRRNGRLIHAEDALFEGDIQKLLSGLPMTQGDVAVASVLLIAPAAEAFVKPVRAIINGKGGVSFWNGKLLARVVAEDGYQLRRILAPLIGLMNQNAPLPKIWAL